MERWRDRMQKQACCIQAGCKHRRAQPLTRGLAKAGLQPPQQVSKPFSAGEQSSAGTSCDAEHNAGVCSLFSKRTFQVGNLHRSDEITPATANSPFSPTSTVTCDTNTSHAMCLHPYSSPHARHIAPCTYADTLRERPSLVGGAPLALQTVVHPHTCWLCNMINHTDAF